MPSQKAEIFLESVTVPHVVKDDPATKSANIITFTMSRPSVVKGDVTEPITLKLEDKETKSIATIQAAIDKENDANQQAGNGKPIKTIDDSDEAVFFFKPIFKELLEGSANSKISIMVTVAQQVDHSKLGDIFVSLAKGLIGAAAGALTGGITNVFMNKLLSNIGSTAADQVQIDGKTITNFARGEV
ncbi:MAG: hypothetical protein HQK99_17255 [Nitrospirae bacterium]|nr:hypothetical protein [Nitrospirota bacterium]